MYAGTLTYSLRDHAVPTQQSARPQKIEIPIKKATDCHICFAGHMGPFRSLHESLHFFATAMMTKKGTLRTPPFLTKAQTHNGTEVKGAKQICKRPSPRKTNMQEPGSTQNKYASTRRHAKQICHDLAACKTKMQAHGGTQNKYAITWRHAKQIWKHPAERKTNMQAPGSTKKQICS